MAIELRTREGLARALTLVESSRREDRLRALKLLEHRASLRGGVRIGISGAPGVGKSTFIETLGLHLLERRHKTAVLAIDPSSPVRGGSLLGDKTRMEKLSARKNAFIRPTPTGGALGGVARHTRESILLCEAAGYEHVLVETVGTGQSEYEAAKMTDFFLLLMQPGAGDGLQALKRGALELAHAVVVNKADGELREAAERAAAEYRAALHLNVREDDAPPTPVFLCSAKEGTGIAEIWREIQRRMQRAKRDGSLQRARALQERAWFDSLLAEMLEQRLNEHPETRRLRERLQQAIDGGKLSPYSAAEQLLDSFLLAAGKA